MSHASLIVAVPPNSATDIAGVVDWNMEPFDENGEWFRDGSRWDWYVIGGRWEGHFLGKNQITVAELDPNKFVEHARKELHACWQESQKEASDHMREMIYGVKAKETEEAFVARNLDRAWFPSSFAFLINRHWHEGERMGFFGLPAKTECELKGKELAQESKCLVKDEKTNAQIVSWNTDNDTWHLKFYDRFIRPLSPDTTLVIVDYHV